VVDGVVELRVPGDLRWRNPVLRFVTEACRLISRGPSADDDTEATTFEAEAVSAFGEAFNNVAIHGYGATSSGLVTIRIEWLRDRLIISMMDEGQTFDPSSVLPPNLDDLPESGMGIYIMKSFMDQVVYQPGPPNRLHLTKIRSPRSDRGMQPPQDPVPRHDARSAASMPAVGQRGGVRKSGKARSGFWRRAAEPVVGRAGDDAGTRGPETAKPATTRRRRK
jgi:serine/threonine-protein kinase RsbW